MKKTILIAAAFTLAAAALAQAYGTNSVTGSGTTEAGKGIKGTSHDLSSSGLNGYGHDDQLDRICVYCHAPHHAAKLGSEEASGVTYLPLWNHGVTSRFYTVYESDFGDGPATPDSTDFGESRHLFNGRDTIGQPGSVSRLCLSCHDGSVAVNEYGFDPGRAESRGAGGSAEAANTIDAQFKIGGADNLTNHHPIGFDYLAVSLLDDEIAAPSTPFNGTEDPTTTIGSLLYNGKMECVTCHDVHNSKNTGETFLWKSDNNSAFCLTCHLK